MNIRKVSFKLGIPLTLALGLVFGVHPAIEQRINLPLRPLNSNLSAIAQQSEFSGGTNLRQPVVSIQVCHCIGMCESPVWNFLRGTTERDGLVRCTVHCAGKAGCYGFSSDQGGLEPWILVRFRGLNPGKHTIKARHYSSSSGRAGTYRWTGGSQDVSITFKNTDSIWAMWFKGKADNAPFYSIDLMLDGYWHGSVKYAGIHPMF